MWLLLTTIIVLCVIYNDQCVIWKRTHWSIKIHKFRFRLKLFCPKLSHRNRMDNCETFNASGSLPPHGACNCRVSIQGYALDERWETPTLALAIIILGARLQYRNLVVTDHTLLCVKKVTTKFRYWSRAPRIMIASARVGVSHLSSNAYPCIETLQLQAPWGGSEPDALNVSQLSIRLRWESFGQKSFKRKRNLWILIDQCVRFQILRSSRSQGVAQVTFYYI